MDNNREKIITERLFNLDAIPKETIVEKILNLDKNDKNYEFDLLSLNMQPLSYDKQNINNITSYLSKKSEKEILKYAQKNEEEIINFLDATLNPFELITDKITVKILNDKNIFDKFNEKAINFVNRVHQKDGILMMPSQTHSSKYYNFKPLEEILIKNGKNGKELLDLLMKNKELTRNTIMQEDIEKLKIGQPNFEINGSGALTFSSTDVYIPSLHYKIPSVEEKFPSRISAFSKLNERNFNLIYDEIHYNDPVNALHKYLYNSLSKTELESIITESEKVIEKANHILDNTEVFTMKKMEELFAVCDYSPDLAIRLSKERNNLKFTSEAEKECFDKNINYIIFNLSKKVTKDSILKNSERIRPILKDLCEEAKLATEVINKENIEINISDERIPSFISKEDFEKFFESLDNISEKFTKIIEQYKHDHDKTEKKVEKQVENQTEQEKKLFQNIMNGELSAKDIVDVDFNDILKKSNQMIKDSNQMTKDDDVR